MMSDAIRAFAKQFAFEPHVEGGKIKKMDRVIVIGMGGSHLAADLALTWNPGLPILVWSDYGLPPLPEKELKKSLIVASSYSGNTEETIAGFEAAQKKGMPLAVIAVGGQLIEMAKARHVPYIQIPDTGIQPRSALGFSLLALFALMGESDGLREANALALTIHPEALEAAGKDLAQKLHDRVPVIYASTRNRAIAYNWKIKMNETGKIPAFFNALPELNHNEMTGFDVAPASKHLSECFSFLFLTDPADHPRVAKRMSILKNLYEDRGLPVTELPLAGTSELEKIFSSLLLADWTAVHIAELYGLESEQVPMVEEFKKLMK